MSSKWVAHMQWGHQGGGCKVSWDYIDFVLLRAAFTVLHGTAENSNPLSCDRSFLRSFSDSKRGVLDSLRQEPYSLSIIWEVTRSHSPQCPWDLCIWVCYRVQRYDIAWCNAQSWYCAYSAYSRWCFFNIVSIERLVWPVLTSQHLQGMLYTPGVFISRSSLIDRRKLYSIFLGRKPTGFDVVLTQRPVHGDRISGNKINLTFVGLGNSQGRAEGFENLPTGVAVLPVMDSLNTNSTRRLSWSCVEIIACLLFVFWWVLGCM
jgi:hypothetical protein